MSKLLKIVSAASVAEHSAVALSEGLHDFGIETDLPTLSSQPSLDSQGRDLLNQLLGQVQMSNAFSHFSRTCGISKLAYVKETKAYKKMKGMNPNGSELSGTWEEFCGLLGISADKADLDIANLRAFGEEALDSMNRIGIGYRDLRQFRRLGQDDRTALIEAAKAGDKDELLDLAEVLISKHSKEKQALANEAEHRDKEINRLNTDLNITKSKLQSEAKRLPPPLLSHEADAQMQKALNAEAMGAAALDLLKRQINEVAGSDAHLEERVLTLHSCLSALAARVSITFELLQTCADNSEISLPERPRMVVSERMARDYLAAHTGYIETAIELAHKALISRNDVLGRSRGRPAGSKNKSQEV
jgi:hypothetical protein